MNRRDLLPECAQPGTPIDVLKNEWCSRCGNPECVRSTVGSKKFDLRVLNWEDKLFKNPPIMAPDDPRFAKIAAMKFITIDPGRVPEIRGEWADPRDLKEPEPAPILATPEDDGDGPVLAPPTALAPSSPPPRDEAPPANPPKPTGSPRSVVQSQILAATNAPDQSGKILRSPAAAPTNRGDPWAVPDAPDPADKVVQPGATIKMGRSGV
jgi:hypothetical protein